MILLRQWASYVAVPIWLTDHNGDLLYYNEPAEMILGQRFDDAGDKPAGSLADAFQTEDLNGLPLPNDELPLLIALEHAKPAHRPLRIKSQDGSSRSIEVTAIPVIGEGDRLLGAMAMLWETDL